ncbi:MAG TPA: hypothetical protein VMN82_15475 [Thermoanaerobaculia bacterium]|nr:hypothetical protein [Thermoanaerobaculia bacterium]
MLEKWIPGSLIGALLILAHWLAYRVKQRRQRPGGGTEDASALASSDEPIEPR